MWTCPNCRQALAPEAGKSWLCPNGHRFDVAREGYVNLLPANRKRSQEPGDNRAMIAARKRVHDALLYQPLATALGEQLGAVGGLDAALDLGCGEGYYTATILEALPGAEILGIDIAKTAVRLAAKRCPRAGFAVASAFDVPLADDSVELVTSIFAPLDEGELSRLLRPGGYYLKVTPAPMHLWELRCALYDNPRPHRSEPPAPAAFEPLARVEVDYPLQVSGAVLGDLVGMTPYAHRGQREKREKLDRVEEMKLQMAFVVSLLRLAPLQGDGALLPGP